MSECQCCSRSNDFRVCSVCLSRMSHQLEDLKKYVKAAAGNLVPSSNGERRSSERGLGVRVDALDLVAGFDVLPVLEDWEREFRSFLGLTPFGPATAARMAARPAGSDIVLTRLDGCITFLQQNLQQAADKHPAIDDFGRELRGLWRQAQAVAGAQQRNVWRVTCPTDSVDGECGSTIRITAQDFDSEVSCRGCGTVWPVERLLLVVASSRHAELWLDPEAASRWFGIPARELRRWAQKGWIKRAGGRYESHSIRAVIADNVQKSVQI